MSPQAKDLPKLKSHNVFRTLKLKKTICDDLGVVSFLGPPLDASTLQDFVDNVYALLPKSVMRRTLFESSLYLCNVELTQQELGKYAWRLAANLDKLIAGEIVAPWCRQTELEWMPMQVVNWQLTKNYQGVICCNYTFRILGGTAASELVTKRLSKRICAGFGRELGFSRKSRNNKRGQIAFHDFADLFGFRLYGLFDPNLSVTSPQFWHMACPPSFRTFNRELIKKRARIDFQCPQQFTHMCSKCPVGVDKCSVATHTKTFYIANCDTCGTATWFDPAQSRDLCVGCITKTRLKGTD